jgi:hypothetical protein
MTGKVTIQWCPDCRAWGSSVRVAKEILPGLAQVNHLGPADFSYLREDQQCASCGAGFVTTTITECNTKNLWQAHARLADMRNSLPSKSTATEIKTDTVWWDHHPELADFSQAFVTK